MKRIGWIKQVPLALVLVLLSSVVMADTPFELWLETLAKKDFYKSEGESIGTFSSKGKGVLGRMRQASKTPSDIFGDDGQITNGVTSREYAHSLLDNVKAEFEKHKDGKKNLYNTSEKSTFHTSFYQPMKEAIEKAKEVGAPVATAVAMEQAPQKDGVTQAEQREGYSKVYGNPVEKSTTDKWIYRNGIGLLVYGNGQTVRPDNTPEHLKSTKQHAIDVVSHTETAAEEKTEKSIPTVFIAKNALNSEGFPAMNLKKFWQVTGFWADKFTRKFLADSYMKTFTHEEKEYDRLLAFHWKDNNRTGNQGERLELFNYGSFIKDKGATDQETLRLLGMLRSMLILDEKHEAWVYDCNEIRRFGRGTTVGSAVVHIIRLFEEKLSDKNLLLAQQQTWQESEKSFLDSKNIKIVPQDAWQSTYVWGKRGLGAVAAVGKGAASLLGELWSGITTQKPSDQSTSVDRQPVDLTQHALLSLRTKLVELKEQLETLNRQLDILKKQVA